MLSTLNAYQRIRKETDIKVRRLFDLKAPHVSGVIDNIVNNNLLFARALTFKLIFSRADNSSLEAFLSARRLFDNELIRIAVKSDDKVALKKLIKNYSQLEKKVFDCSLIN